MIYKKYGEVFKTIRQQHGFALSYFESVGISKGMLSRFENGKSMLSFDKLILALQEMNMSLQIFLVFINNKVPDYVETKFKSIDTAYWNGNTKKLKEIYEEHIQYYNPKEGKFGIENYVIAFSAKAHFSPLKKDELEKIGSYLERVIVWSLYELNILLNLVEQLPLELLCKLMKKLIHDEEYRYIWTNAEFRLLIVRVIFRTSLRYIEVNMKNNSQSIIEQSRVLIPEDDFTCAILIRFAEGYWFYKYGNEILGNKIMKQVIKILEDIDAVHYRNFFIRYLRKIRKLNKGAF